MRRSRPPEPAGLAAEEVPDLAVLVRRAAARWPDRVAWTFDGGEELTFADVQRRTDDTAVALAGHGIGGGDRVAVMLGNIPEFPIVWLALAGLGATIVPLNPKYRSADTRHLLDSARCVAAVTLPQWRSAVDGARPDEPELRVLDVAQLAGPQRRRVPAAELTPDAVANVQFTSGTTGRPKGCLLSHRYWLTLGASLVTDFPRLREQDVMLTAQPFHYVDPMWNVVAALLCGARLVVLDGFHPSSFWGKVSEHRATYFYCLAAMPTLLLTTPPSPRDRDHRVRLVQCSAIPPARHAEIEARWGVKWYEAFGMTETGADLRVTDREHDDLVGTGCVGAPAAHREARVVDPDTGTECPAGVTGELVLRGRGMMSGYDGDPAATAKAFRGGWFHTGDLARADRAGRIYLTGRIKDMIRRAGENIAAREVEDVLQLHPDVRIAAVVPVADELRGEEAKAVVVATGALRDPAALAEFCADRLAGFKVPRYWEFRDRLPLTASERVHKPALGTAASSVWDRTTGEWR